MSATLSQENNASKQMVAALAAGYAKLSERRRDRVDKMLDLFKRSEDVAEQGEILHAIFEIVAPEIIKRSGSAGVTANLEEGVRSDSKEKVRSHREYVGKVIAMKRANARMTQEQLAKKARIPQSHVCRIETGKHMPTSMTIKRIADALGVAPESLDVMYEVE